METHSRKALLSSCFLGTSFDSESSFSLSFSFDLFASPQTLYLERMPLFSLATCVQFCFGRHFDSFPFGVVRWSAYEHPLQCVKTRGKANV